jgi:hypothetical protein
VRAQFDLSTGTLINQSGTTSTFITPYGNGWYRVGFTYTQATTVSAYWNLLVINTDDNSGSAPAAWAGNGTSSVAFWGSQIELGAYATSYIPTTSAAVTRLQDVASKTGISSLIGQTEGTLFVELVWKGHIAAFQSIEIFGNSNNRIGIYSYDATNTFRWFVFGNGLVPFEQNITSALVIGQRYKIAIAYKSGDSVAYVNGTQTFSSSATFTFNNALNDLYYRLGSGVDPLFQPISQNLLFKTRLTNAQLAELTTL